MPLRCSWGAIPKQPTLLLAHAGVGELVECEVVVPLYVPPRPGHHQLVLVGGSPQLGR